MARMSGLPAAAARERTADTLRHVGLYEERYRPIGGYSTGMRQRVKLAQALVHDPKLIFLDEPTNGLDPAGRDDMLALIRRIGTDFGISVLVASHLLGELERICDHVVIIDSGRLLRSSEIAAYTRFTQVLAVEVTDGVHEDGAGALSERLTRAGVTVHRVGRQVEVQIHDEATYDQIRDLAAELGVGLCSPMPVPSHQQGAGGVSGFSSTSGPPRGATSGVIHDIGYRGYDGARLGRWYLVRSLFSHSLRGAYGLGRPARSKVMPMLLFATMTFPALIMVVVTVVTKADSLPLHPSDYIPITFYISSIFVASQSPQLVSRDLRFRLVPLYFSRPITYADYVLAKYAAMASALLILMATPLAIMYGGALLAELRASNE